ncbi:MAG: hypothetical protein HW378_4758, partial [Anaerolineales bacterium]|nr:hypothetical protein [Anaerolineales bacterium]
YKQCPPHASANRTASEAEASDPINRGGNVRLAPHNDQGHRQPPGSGRRQRIQRPMNLPHRLAPRLAAVRWTALLCVLGCGPSKPGSNRRKKARGVGETGSGDPHCRATRQTLGGKINDARGTRRLTEPRPRPRRLIRYTGAEMSCLLRITTKLRHAGPTAQDFKTSANRRCLERMVRFPVSETRSADASERQRVMPRSGEAIRQPRAPDPAVVMQLPAAWEADEAERPVMIRCPRDQWPAAD